VTQPTSRSAKIMAEFIRYALATVCCIAFWCKSNGSSRSIAMTRRKLAKRIWPPVFMLATAMMLGFCSGYYFMRAGKVGDVAIAVVGISWAIIPMAMRFWAKQLVSQGRLPGTGSVSE
jgi:hypothetical protein